MLGVTIDVTDIALLQCLALVLLPFHGDRNLDSWLFSWTFSFIV